MTERFLNYGQAPGTYPDRLLALRQYFTPDPGFEHANILPIKYDPQGRPSLGMPEALMGSGRFTADVLASPYTGTLPEGFVAETALNALGGAPGEGTALRTFLGAKAKTADTRTLQIANMMERRGADPEVIRQQTGWHRGTDRQWRFEISDQPAKYQPEKAFEAEWERRHGLGGKQKEMFPLPPKTRGARLREKNAQLKAIRAEGFRGRLGDVYEHPELYAAHPELADKPIHFIGETEAAMNPELLGYHDPATGTVGIHPDFATARGTVTDPVSGKVETGKGVLAHELQHAVQEREGFQPGSNVNLFRFLDQEASTVNSARQFREDAAAMGEAYARRSLDNARNLGLITPKQHVETYRLALNPQVTDAQLAARSEFPAQVRKTTKGPAEAYKRSSGEVEARNVENRLEMTPEQIRANPPAATQDVWPRDELLIPNEITSYIKSLMPQGLQRAEKGNPFFDLTNLEQVPDVPQAPIERYQPRKISPRLADLLGNKKVQKGVRDIVEKGVAMGGQRWYNAEPLRKAFIDELGDTEGDAAFGRYMDYVAATSPRSSVPENIRNASFYYGLERQGQPPPEVGTRNPQPYGHMAQRLHQMNAQTIAGGGFDPLKNPKPPSFAANLTGNQLPVTVDAHATKLPGMLSRDPRWLASSVNIQTPGTGIKGGPPKAYTAVKPRQMVIGGEMTMDEALKRPFFWEGQPGPTEYAGLERDLYQPIANRLGISPAQAQASAWMAGGDITGLGSPSTMGFMDLFERKLQETAQKRDLPAQEVLRRMIRGEQPLLSTPVAPPIVPVAPPQQQPLELTITTPRGPGMDQNRLLQLMGTRS